ncbi:hypothetical protein F2Q69_00049450 [Brassica cretica]|uniref:Replication protein A 70 kDa DNA-binding subunit B/D first OB fold domain-containing protein n=1 Tax=Brassica cretica TaxID=69181 RepID=A0A8S9PRM5_BRACR|nr:hypothetical protein F2Q69_00049450 [Brassica cretica]
MKRDKMALWFRGFKIHCTCKRLFFARVRKFKIGEWRFLENFSLHPATGKYRATSHRFKMSIVGNSTVSESSLENDDNFLSLTPFQSIINGSLDSNFLIDVIGQAVDVGDIEVVQVLACCLWGRFAEQVLAAYKNAEENNILCLVRYAKINVYKGQVQITNAFETSSVVINPDGFDVQDYLRLPTNELALSTVTRDVVKPKGKKRLIDKWSLYPERSVLDIIMATESVTNVAPQFKLHLLIKDDYGETRVMLLDTVAEPILGVSADVLLGGSLDEVEDPEDLSDVINDLIGKTYKFGVYVNKDNVDYGADIFAIEKTWGADEIITEDDDTLTNDVSSDRSSGPISLISIESEDNTCLSSTPLSKRRVDSDLDDLSSTSKKQCFKIIKVEKNNGE